MSKHFTDRDLIIIRNRQGENLPVPPAPKKRNNEESQFQQAAVRWWAVACRGYGLPDFALIAHPNQGHRTIINATRMKREGARKGTLDMQLTVARGGFHGLWIENKAEKGDLREEQKAHWCHLVDQNYHVALCRSLDDFIKTVTNYLKL